MCGRYTHRIFWNELHRLMELTTPVQLPIRYNIAPTQTAPVVRIDDRERSRSRSLAMLRWGLLPSWARDIKVGSSLINARAEGIESKPSFREAFRRQRCLVPASGFYEWKRLANGKVRQPYYISTADQKPIAFAGLWESWHNTSHQGEPVETFTIITTTPNEMMAPLHDRMPVILDPQDFPSWLDPGNKDTAGLLALLRPYPAELMQSHPVSPRVNSPAFDDPSCIESVKELPIRESQPPGAAPGLWDVIS
ncbi:MAG: SOS response-associated peptidase [Pyrinomonadaceae bacterium]|nr:SOS response-associated peptidase [Phycisphaerales bacterium]